MELIDSNATNYSTASIDSPRPMQAAPKRNLDFSLKCPSTSHEFIKLKALVIKSFVLYPRAN